MNFYYEKNTTISFTRVFVMNEKAQVTKNDNFIYELLLWKNTWLSAWLIKK